ncbi:MAG: ATP-binding cassette domain-containing protein [Acutalibacteraceae bacterium]
MLSIVGSSGAGKTTICKAIMGLLGSTYKATGEVWFQGKNLLSLSKRVSKIYGKEICFIMQNL